MPSNQNLTPHINYIPAELKRGKRWNVVYHVINPFLEPPTLVRKRVSVKPLKIVKMRKELAANMVQGINDKLRKGWNPFLENPKSKQFTKLLDAFKVYLNELNREAADGNMRPDTLRTYTSRLNIFEKWLTAQGLELAFCYKLDEDLLNDFLDYLRYTKGVSARTRDNYFTAIRTFCLWAVRKKYLPVNPCECIKKIKKGKTKKIVIPTINRDQIFTYLQENDPDYLTLCLVCYYCLVRRTELSKLTVGDINIKNATLFISSDDAKNRQSAHVTIPKPLLNRLANHIKSAEVTDYLFSDDGYKAGKKAFLPNKCTSRWSRMRTTLQIDKAYKWYDLKSTGITDLITSGVPLISVRDQARHHSITQTDEYTPRNHKKANNEVLNSGLNFETV